LRPIPEVVAAFDQGDLLRLLSNEGLVQSKGKLKATLENARTFMELAEKNGSFEAWLHSFDDFESTHKALIKAFKYIGNFSAYWLLFTWKEPVPDWKEWGPANGYTG